MKPKRGQQSKSSKSISHKVFQKEKGTLEPVLVRKSARITLMETASVTTRQPADHSTNQTSCSKKRMTRSALNRVDDNTQSIIDEEERGKMTVECKKRKADTCLEKKISIDVGSVLKKNRLSLNLESGKRSKTAHTTLEKSGATLSIHSRPKSKQSLTQSSTFFICFAHFHRIDDIKALDAVPGIREEEQETLARIKKSDAALAFIPRRSSTRQLKSSKTIDKMNVDAKSLKAADSVKAKLGQGQQIMTRITTRSQVSLLVKERRVQQL